MHCLLLTSLNWKQNKHLLASVWIHRGTECFLGAGSYGTALPAFSGSQGQPVLLLGMILSRLHSFAEDRCNQVSAGCFRFLTRLADR